MDSILKPTFPVAEIFGPTIQGEGPLAGLPCSFVRFGGCDYKCIWCDSPHAVLPTKVRQLKRLTAYEIVVQLSDLYGFKSLTWVVFSGGNPLLYDLKELVDLLHSDFVKVQVETQGTKWKPWLEHVDKLVISPKPPSAQIKAPGNLSEFMDKCERMSTQQLALKVVVFTMEDYRYAKAIHKKFPAIPFYLSCGTSPEETVYTKAARLSIGQPDSPESLGKRYRWLAETASTDPAMRDVRVYPQLHAIAWGNERGR